MSALRSTGSVKQIRLNLLLLILISGAICGSAARLWLEVRDTQGAKLHSEVAGSNIAHSGGFTTETAEISFQGENIRSGLRLSSSLGYNNKDAKEFVFNVFPKGPVTPSGPSHKGYEKVTERRLSASKHSPGGGHMGEGRKRILGSVPSPGVGH